MYDRIIPPHLKYSPNDAIDGSQRLKKQHRCCRCGEITVEKCCFRCGFQFSKSEPSSTCAACGLVFYNEDLPPFCSECGMKLEF